MKPHFQFNRINCGEIKDLLLGKISVNYVCLRTLTCVLLLSIKFLPIESTRGWHAYHITYTAKVKRITQWFEI